MKEFVLTKKDLEAVEKLIPKSTKILVKYFEPIFNHFDPESGLEIPETAKAKLRESISIKDIPRYLKYHPNIAVVISVGSKIMEEEDYEPSDIVFLRTVPGMTDLVMFNGENYFSIDNAMILCMKKL